MRKQEHQSRMGSPRKYYRWFRGHTHAHLNDWFKPRAIISSNFALFPTMVDNKLTWLTTYSALETISSAFSFGGTTSISYTVVKRSKSIFSFKEELKKEKIILNLIKEKRKNQERFNSWPTEFQKQFIKYFKK